MRFLCSVFIFILFMMVMSGIFGCVSIDPVTGCTKKETKKSEKLMNRAFIKCPGATLAWTLDKWPTKVDTVEKPNYITGPVTYSTDTLTLRDTIAKEVIKYITRNITRVDTFKKETTITRNDPREKELLTKQNDALKDQLSRSQSKVDIIPKLWVAIIILSLACLSLLYLWFRK